MSDEKRTTETKTKAKSDFLGNPKEQKSVTTEKTEREGMFGDEQSRTKTETKQKSGSSGSEEQWKSVTETKEEP